MCRSRLVFVALQAVLAGAASTAPAQDELGKQVQSILKGHCYSCHGEGGKAEGGFYALSYRSLLRNYRIVAGDAEGSVLYKKLKSGDMPKDSDPLSEEQQAVIKKWIEAGAPDFNPPAARRKLIRNAELVQRTEDHLRSLARDDRPFARYLSLANLYNAAYSDDEMATYRAAVSKLVNSLSWSDKVTPPTPIDAEKTILYLDIRNYKWTDKVWKKIDDLNPYASLVRADWFVFAASRPPLYHELLDLPLTDLELEKRLRIDVDQNLSQRKAVRAGFNGSGVSKYNNRLIERHASDLTRGAYWKSYDFANSTGKKNLFDHPLGPKGKNAFEHDGGEIIFTLPNGLQAYLLVNAKGQRIDTGPTEIVEDPLQKGSVVINGISCMSCHVQGMIFKRDQVRGAVEKNLDAYPRPERDDILALYPKYKDFETYLVADQKRFLERVQQTGVKLGTADPVVQLALRFEDEVDLYLGAAEVGLEVDEFIKEVDIEPTLGRTLGALKVPGGTVKRQVFHDLANNHFRKEWKNWDPLGSRKDGRTASSGRAPSGSSGNDTGSPDEPAEPIVSLPGHTGAVMCIAFSPDGRSAVTHGGLGDHSFHVWDISKRKRVQKSPHAECAAVAAVWTSEGLVLSGGDGGILLQDPKNGERAGDLIARGSAVRSVAISSNGKQIALLDSSGLVRVFDAKTKAKLQDFENGAAANSIAFSPDGRFLLSGGGDMRCWNLKEDRQERLFEGHTASVGCVAFSSDGQRAFSASFSPAADSDGTIRIWNAQTGKETDKLEVGGEGRLTAAAFSADGSRALTGHSNGDVRLWDLKTKKNLVTFSKHKWPVQSVALSPDGRFALSGEDCQGGSEMWLYRLPRP